MTKDEHLRLVTFRSKFLEHAKRIGNVSATCRYFGISREKFYKWKRRFDELGDAGLADRPRRPHRSPNATPRAVVSKVLYLRQNYHFGAGRIRDYLKRFHGIRIAGQTVQNILHKHGLGRLPANQKHQPHGKRWQRYEKPQPGHRVQMDVKFLERIPGTKKRLYQFTAIDDCTRIRVLKIYDACNQTASVDFANEVIRRLPFRVLVVQTDNGSEFGSHFHWHLESLDIRHDGGLGGQTFDDWVTTFNHVRPHEALGQRLPGEVYRVSERRLARCTPFVHRDGRSVMRLNRQGAIRYDSRNVYISYGLVGQEVGLEVVADGAVRVWFCNMLLGAFVPHRDETIQPFNVDEASAEPTNATTEKPTSATATSTATETPTIAATTTPPVGQA